MQILILSVSHQIQPSRIKSMSTDGSVEAFERSQKEAFGQMLRTKVRERWIRFIGEEARHGEETAAQRVCELQDCHYANIDMTPAEREHRNIPPGYADEGSNLSETEIIRCHREREEFMCAKALTEAGNVDSILIICGRFHAEEIAANFGRLGHNVELLDLRNQSWYIENWAEHAMRKL